MNHTFISILHFLNGTGIICTAIVFGTDTFFAVIGKEAATKSKESSRADVFGHFHELADRRMPLFGVTAILTTIAQIIMYGIRSADGIFAMIALLGMLSQLSIYIAISKPINTILVDSVKYGRVLNNARALQERWDKVIIWRAVSLLVSMICLIMINYTGQ